MRVARAARFSWKFGYPLSADDPTNVACVQAFSRIRKETDGEMAITSYPNSALGGTVAMIGQLRLGALECSATSNPSIDTLLPAMSTESLAFAFRDNASALRALDGDLGNYLRSQTPSIGIVMMPKTFDFGFRQFTNSTRPIRTLGDLDGLKIRAASGRLFSDFFRSLGIQAATLDTNELYSALRTHVVDGQETPLGLIESQRLYDVQRFCSLTRHMWTGQSFMINRAKWESLPAEYQEIVARNVNQSALSQRRIHAVIERSLIDKLPRQGMAINQTDPESFKARLAATGYYARWRKEFGETAWQALEKYAGPLG